MSTLTTILLIISILNLVNGGQSPAQLQRSKEKEAFFNKTSYIKIPALSLHNHIGLTFRTCVSGPLFVQNTEKTQISLNVTVEGLVLSIVLPLKTYETFVTGHFLDNSWHQVNLITRPANMTLSISHLSSHLSAIVANSTFNNELMSTDLTLMDGTSKLVIGEGFVGCMLEGPSLIFNNSISEKYNIEWGRCSHVPCNNSSSAASSTSGICSSSSTDPSSNCTCPAGFTGQFCKEVINECSSNPCQNGASCMKRNNGYTCQCPAGFTGAHCEADIDECQLNICKNGHCVNLPGSYQCYCTPGFTGDHCELDVDECLPHPCLNGATCHNGLNKYSCICPPGFTGRECGIDINECDSNPCKEGGTCIDGNATFTCKCPPGLAGATCEENIDECESAPCLNNGTCIDGLDRYDCNCSDTGFVGEHCETNVDDCATNPCYNSATCIDLVKDYICECYPGYRGKDCKEDIKECDSNPCQSGGTCLERSNRTLYEQYDSYANLPVIYSHNFSFATAHGYECQCIPGVMGTNCEIDVKECDSNPCKNGATCKEEIGKYSCECGSGYEGTHCEIEINECDRYKPCLQGTCKEPKPAYYECECYSGYGGKNCSVPLTGCTERPTCSNNGTCIPYVVNENEHKFNCTCPSGYHGPTCEWVTTMSLNGESYVVMNTTRDEGYDISFRFKTTLPSGLLALGKGSTFYILELMNGRLNLHSSLLNKWEGVFTGSQLNDSNWQKVFVAINSSHVVLAANEEQTIYPISYTEQAYSNMTSFPTSYVGGTVTHLRQLAHGPAVFTGCIENVVINGHWVIPQKKDEKSINYEMNNIEVGCQRRDQCSKNPCHSGGQCTDLWKTFSCTCQRPYLGNQCQYNLTAATFGHENINNSLVTVSVATLPKKAIRNIVDISMFIRTRQSKGAVFYLGSLPGSVSLLEETHIAAELDGGELLVRIQFNGTPESYTVGGVKLTDGFDHLIQVVRNVTLVQVKINGTEYFRKTIGASGPLDAQVLYLGGFPSQASDNDTIVLESTSGDPHRANRDVTAGDLSSGDGLMRLARQTPVKFENVPHFKGIIQDVQVSNGSLRMRVEFFPLKVKDLALNITFGSVSFDPNTVLEGVLSDDSCAPNPCANGAECTVTWNDYFCVCPPGYKGKQCKEMEFCQQRKCPKNSECRNLQHGYECVSNITMKGAQTGTALAYSFEKRDEIPSLNTINLMYRSRTGGTLLFICNKEESSPLKHLYFFVFILHDEMTVVWKLDANSPEQYQSIKKEHSDGEWTSINMKILQDNKIIGSFGGAGDEPGQEFSSNNFSSSAWYSLVTSGKIYIGGGDEFLKDALLSDKNSYLFENETNTLSDPLSDVVTAEGNSMLRNLSSQSPNGLFYKGCVGEVRIGGILLPFFVQNDLNNTYFTLQNNITEDDVVHACHLCFQSDCKNGGRCSNETESYGCTCEPGFDAEDCSHDIDECVGNECVHGATCVDGVANYTCKCTIGWSGWLCDQNIDECMSQPCQHNGTCIDYLGFYKCNCTDDYVGKHCEQLKQVTCENKPCHYGANCLDIPNKNGDNFTCSCLVGYVGTYCDRMFCSEKPCRNNGQCTIQKNRPVCNCSRGFAGMYCEENVNDCVTQADGFPPCLNGGKCIDGVEDYHCNCSGTGYKGSRCEIDIDECEEHIAHCGFSGTCQNENGTYRCECTPDVCGFNCDLYNPCRDKPCENGGICREECRNEPNYKCTCPPDYTGKNCTEVQLMSADSVAYYAKFVVPVLAILLIGVVVSVVMFFMMARNKRATRGTYSPSSQEYCNPRVELDNVMKPPPEERLI